MVTALVRVAALATAGCCTASGAGTKACTLCFCANMYMNMYGRVSRHLHLCTNQRRRLIPPKQNERINPHSPHGTSKHVNRTRRRRWPRPRRGGSWTPWLGWGFLFDLSYRCVGSAPLGAMRWGVGLSMCYAPVSAALGRRQQQQHSSAAAAAAARYYTRCPALPLPPHQTGAAAVATRAQGAPAAIDRAKAQPQAASRKASTAPPDRPRPRPPHGVPSIDRCVDRLPPWDGCCPPFGCLPLGCPLRFGCFWARRRSACKLGVEGEEEGRERRRRAATTKRRTLQCPGEGGGGESTARGRGAGGSRGGGLRNRDRGKGVAGGQSLLLRGRGRWLNS